MTAEKVKALVEAQLTLAQVAPRVELTLGRNVRLVLERITQHVPAAP